MELVSWGYDKRILDLTEVFDKSSFGEKEAQLCY